MAGTRRLCTRGAVVAPLAVLLALAAMPGSVAAGGSDPARLSLEPGQKVFWDGEHVERAQVPASELCGPCPTYKLLVRQPAARLRVALHAMFPDPGGVRQWPDFLPAAPEMMFEVQVADPAGATVASGSTRPQFTNYAVEVFVEAPVAGEYTVKVIPTSVVDMAFRMRAMLEPEAPSSDGSGQLLSPNLRVIPPFEFNFYPPTVGFGPGAGVPAPSASCMAEEIEEALAEDEEVPKMCLRFSLGFENAGEGRFGLAFEGQLGLPFFDLPTCAFTGNEPKTCDPRQRRWTRDGTSSKIEDASAGTATFHATHQHFHYENVYEAELLAVERQLGSGPPTLTPVTPGRKFGVFPGNEMMADWHRFWPACGNPLPQEPTGCHHDRDAAGGDFIELQAGWGDVYEWNRSGNYAPFPEQAPGVPRAGRYVLRVRTDPQGRIIESDDSDNTGYALIEVLANGNVVLLERGRGTDPWDNAKEVRTVAP